MTRPIRVLLWFWGRRGGGPRYTHELAKALKERSDVEVYISLSKQSDYFKRSYELNFKDRFDVDTYRSRIGFVFGALKLPLLRWRFRRFLRKNKIDIVLCTMDHLWNVFTAKAVRESGALYMLVVHDATRHPGESPRWRQWLLKEDISMSDGAIVLTHSVGELLKAAHNYPESKIFRSAHGHFGEYILDMPRELPLNRPMRLLFFGRILPYKGLDILLDAMVILLNKYTEFELEIWGSGDFSAYQEKIDQLTNVRLHNRWIDESEMPAIFENTDILVLPYREASQSGVIGMAQAYGMPSIVTPISGLSEQVSDEFNGIVASAIDANSLANGILKLTQDPLLYKRLSMGCIKTVSEELSWARIGGTVAESLKALTNSK